MSAVPQLSYEQMMALALQYYQQTGTGDVWVPIGEITPQTIETMQQVPEYALTVAENGSIVGYDYSYNFPAVQNQTAIDLNSNAQTGLYGPTSYTAQVPGTAEVDSSTGNISMVSGAKTVTSGATLATIADKVSLGVAGVALGTKLGAFIDRALYSIDPEWWDEHLPSINPETWDDMIASTDTGKGIIRAIFGLSDDSTTMYLDERALAQTYAMLLAEGYYDSSEEGEASIEDTTGLNQEVINNMPYPCSQETFIYATTSYESGPGGGSASNAFETLNHTAPVYCFALDTSATSTRTYYFCSKASFSGTLTSHNPGGTRTYISNFTATRQTFNGKQYYVYSYPSSYANTYSLSIPEPSEHYFQLLTAYLEIAYIILYGTITQPATIEGITPNPNAGIHINPETLINPSTGQPVTPQDNPEDILQALKTTYPSLFANEIYEDVPQQDGTLQTRTYVPVPYPNTETEEEPVTQPQPGIDPQLEPELNPETVPEAQLERLTESLTEQAETNAPDVGTGTVPAIVMPEGSSSALYTVYNPSQSELNAFGAWLWSSNFIDQLLKLFNDPMQAIIGLHKVFVNPSISGRGNIHVGYLDSGVASNVVGGQYVTVNCGNVYLNEYFGNVFDYDPFTNVYIYLPFVGIQKLDTGDVMRGVLNVVYHVDVITGACLVEVNVNRDGGAGGTIYTYTGNCAVQYPISSGSYMGIVASLASVVGGVVGTIATGGAVAPLAMGAVNGVLNAHTRIQHSGGFSGNAGAMGNKTPYIIITRPQIATADNFPHFEGFPANQTTKLNNCSGFVKCSVVHGDYTTATETEIKEIESILQTGVLI